jgi:hypothetical protein
VECLTGKHQDVVKREIADGFQSGRFHAPQRPALIFMMSSAQLPASPDGTSVGKFLAGLLPQIRNADYGLVESEDNSVPAVLETDRRCQP